MLKLIDITKEYRAGEEKVMALKGVSLEFSACDFVSILGPSGCGKTTMLNIIGGLDRYSLGDLIINGKSTKEFKDKDWDAYRNSCIGFVFQNYNLISHLTVLNNVEIALTLSGVSAAERKRRAKEALTKVGLSDQFNKKPNQLSGGQMQRVAIARAIVNNPEILLADEPSGALDSHTSVQIMDLLKEISRDRLVIMVTHNKELAEEYSTRIIKLLDGQVKEDKKTAGGDSDVASTRKMTKAGDDVGAGFHTRPKEKNKTSMSFFAALKLSFNNLKTKKVRTIITAIAGSIGIIGVALVLAISTGMTSYVNAMQRDTLTGFPIIISKTSTMEISRRGNNLSNDDEFIKEEIVLPYDKNVNSRNHVNNIDKNYLDYLEGMDSNLYNSITYSYLMKMNLLAKDYNGNVKAVSDSKNLNWQQLPNNNYLESQVDVLSGELPKNSGEVLLIVDKFNRVEVELLKELGIDYDLDQPFDFDFFLNYSFKIAKNNDFYVKSAGKYKVAEGAELDSIYDNSKTLTISGIARVKKSVAVSLIDSGLGYTSALVHEMLADALNSDIVADQKNSDVNVFTGIPFIYESEYDAVMGLIGGTDIPFSVMIFPKSFAAKDEIKAYLDDYNIDKDEDDRILYTDLADAIGAMIGSLISTITIVLTAFAAISLVVSTIMISIITYVSVVERTKEIGILRSIGARKKDISRVFNAETVIIGFAAGLIGIFTALILTIPINIIINNLAGVSGVARISVWLASSLIAVSVGLTLISGLIPSQIASKKDPVTALRSE